MRQKVVLALIWPFLGFVLFFQRLQLRQNRLLSLIFISLTSFFLIPYEEGDIRLYTRILGIYSDLNIWESIQYLFNEIFTVSDGSFEFYVSFITFINSFFSNSPSFSFLITALVYFFFWNKTVSGLTDLSNNSKLSSKAYVLICFVALYVLFFRAINGRFYLAYWVFLASVFQIFYKENRNYWGFMIFTIFIHQSYIFVIGVLALNYFTKGLRKYSFFEFALFGLIFLSLFDSGSGLSLIRDTLSLLSEYLDLGFMEYAKESYVLGQQERDRPWFLEFRLDILFYSAVLVFLHGRFKYKVYDLPGLKSMYYFILLFWVINTWSIEVPTFGYRFRTVLTGLILLYICLDFILRRRQNFAWPHYFLSLSFTFYIIVTVKIFSYYLSIWSFFPFPYLVELFDVEMVLDDILKFI